MVVNNGYYRKYIQNLIDQQPDILLKDTEVKTPDGFGGNTISTVQTELKVRLYKNRKSLSVIQESGLLVAGSGVSIKALCDGDVVVSEGDTITSSTRQYRVAFVHRYFGICIQLELDVIK